MEWTFLEQILFSEFPHQLDLFNYEVCKHYMSFAVKVNGNPHREFSPFRGLRQGDPLLSPYLFIIYVEALSARLEKLARDRMLHGLKIANYAPMISHLFFVDDSIIFSRATTKEESHILAILNSYEATSGQRINNNKSELSCSQNVLSTRFEELTRLLEVKAVESHDKYLGFPTLIGRSKTQIFKFVRDRVWKKLKGWKERALSQVGREVLIKSVVQSIFQRMSCMGCFALPPAI